MPNSTECPRPEYLRHCSKTNTVPEQLPAKPETVRGPRGEPIVPASNIPNRFRDESMCSN